ncbi:MAG: hypothetical protein Q8O56_07110 [Solirubrobacteraceae bacterium]|nr:hypothetical protein [Solirubrobacteraceae bacterium]
MKKVLITLAVGVGAALLAASAAQAQQACPPGQTGNLPYCQVIPPPPPPPPLPEACGTFTAKLSLARATFNARARNISILAPLTRLASGAARISVFAAGRTTTFNAPIDSANGRIRVTRSVPAAQARLGTGILTLRYAGDADTRPQTVRLRAANTPARLTAQRPTITSTGALRAQGTVSRSARGVVRVQLEYVNRLDGQIVTLERTARINNGRWSLNSQLSQTILAQIALRCGTVHSYTLFTGYLPARMRGEMRAYQVLPSQ